MRYCMRLAPMILAVLVAANGLVMAAGYQRYSPDAAPGPRSPYTDASCRSLSDALQQAAAVQKYPEYLDAAAALVKDILSQFGVVEKKTP